MPDACDMVVASAAIKPAPPGAAAPRTAARRAHDDLRPGAGALHGVGRTGVCIAGTHGKSSITAMLGAALTDAGLDPTVIVGAACRQLAAGCLAPEPSPGTNAQAGGPSSPPTRQEGGLSSPPPTGFRLGAERIPSGPYAGRPGLLLAEACEFNRSFHNLRPTIAAITSVEADHLDIYGSLDAVVEASRSSPGCVPPAGEGGYLLIAHEGAHRRQVAAGLDCQVETIGFSPAADWVVSFDSRSREVALTRRSELVARWTMRIPGAHNAMNAATAARWRTPRGRAGPRGAERWAFRGLSTGGCSSWATACGGVRVYDDYGHHPTEVDATLRALRDFERPHDRGGRLVCVFQPHQHSRTRFLLDEFAQSFSQADMVIVPHIYFVRDSEHREDARSAPRTWSTACARGRARDAPVPLRGDRRATREPLPPNDLLVVMGAGPVWKVARGYLRSPNALPLRGTPR
jgi:UDP-N-acetylmuramate--alanine ligase